MTTVRSDSYLTLHYRISTVDGDEFLSTFDMGRTITTRSRRTTWNVAKRRAP